MRHDLSAGREGVFSSEYDYLTEALSREEFATRAKQILSESHDSRQLLLLIDIDRFREINEKYGYVQGDEILRVVAGRIRQACGDGIVGRIADDMFAVLLKSAQTYPQAEELLCRINAVVRLPADGVLITCGIGGAWFPNEGREYKTLEEAAWEKLLEAKSLGRNRFRISHPEN